MQIPTLDYDMIGISQLRALNLLPDYPEQANEELEQVLNLTAEIRKLRQKEAIDVD